MLKENPPIAIQQAAGKHDVNKSMTSYICSVPKQANLKDIEMYFPFQIPIKQM